MEGKGLHITIMLMVLVVLMLGKPVASDFECCRQCAHKCSSSSALRTNLDCVRRCYKACGTCQGFIKLQKGNLSLSLALSPLVYGKRSIANSQYESLYICPPDFAVFIVRSNGRDLKSDISYHNAVLRVRTLLS